MKNEKRVGIALGAGASKGFAHIGVLQVLMENNIPIDIVTGCSMGALIGALYVTGSDMYFLERYAIAFNMSRFFDFSVNSAGLIRGKKFQQLIRILTKNKKIEDSAIPFACLAVDAEYTNAVVFKEGYFYDAVRASISIPGIFDPYEYNGHVYIDGSVLDRVPVQAAKNLGADFVIGVDVGYRGQKLKKPVNAIDTMKAVINICDWHIAQEKMKDADILLTPEIGDVNLYSNKEAEETIKKGREATQEMIPRIKEMLKAISD